ncbi:lipopolysaccharide biosynthesis protein [Candidatus Marinimicrobia bacterium]|nr:lipopolysaccharide biosynthesis protein [Candidatus Neomarinimicrobiota bacterium]
MTSLKNKTITGLLWSFLDNFSNQGILFIVGIILARLLEPYEFGLIAMIMIFIALSESFINSGFSQALIQKKDSNNIDFSTVFYFNIVVAFIFIIVLYFSAPFISIFFQEPRLTLIVRYSAIILIIDAFALVQKTILTRNINFKLQAKISILASLSSGIIAILMAYLGFGVWSLVVKIIIQKIINTILLWHWNKWRPKAVFSTKSFNKLFPFGSRLLVSGLLETVYQNIYYLIIGKYFSVYELGYYTRANQFQKLPSSNISGVINRVTYPVLSKLQDDKTRLKSAFKKLVSSTMLISFVLMFGLAAIAEPLIISLIGEKWAPSIIYLQLLCFVGVQYPIHAINLNLLKVKGRTDLFLRLEIIKKILAIPVVIFGVYFGINMMIIAMIIFSVILFFLNSYWTEHFVEYSGLSQLKNISKSFFIASIVSIIIYILGNNIPFDMIYILLIQIILGAILTISLLEATELNEYIEIKNIIKPYINNIKI